MYCKSCGKRLDDDSVFCDSCGVKVGAADYYPASAVCTVPCKSKGIAILCSLIIMGGGHLYADDISKGVLLLLFGLVLSAVMVIFFFFSLFLSMLIALIFICLWIYSISDSCKKVDEYNRRVGRMMDRR